MLATDVSSRTISERNENHLLFPVLEKENNATFVNGFANNVNNLFRISLAALKLESLCSPSLSRDVEFVAPAALGGSSSDSRTSQGSSDRKTDTEKDKACLFNSSDYNTT